MSTLFYPVITYLLISICIAYWTVTAVYPSVGWCKEKVLRMEQELIICSGYYTKCMQMQYSGVHGGREGLRVHVQSVYLHVLLVFFRLLSPGTVQIHACIGVDFWLCLVHVRPKVTRIDPSPL